MPPPRSETAEVSYALASQCRWAAWAAAKAGAEVVQPGVESVGVGGARR